MCGRFNVIDDPITQTIMDVLGIDFSVTTNDNVCPSELVSCLSMDNANPIQLNAHWGIKPDWANKLLINAQSETVSSKKTFKQAFLSERCLVPLSGWYEWQTDESGKKQKFLFSNQANAMFMAAVMYRNEAQPEDKLALDLFGEPITNVEPERQFVSLTTKANDQCSPIHSRMPLIIPAEYARDWLSDDLTKATDLLSSQTEGLFISKQ